jgi:hypothetical protein
VTINKIDNVVPFEKPDDSEQFAEVFSVEGMTFLDAALAPGLVDKLEVLAGDLEAFCAHYCQSDKTWLIYTVEKLLKEHTDKELFKRWKAAKKLNLTVRISLLQSEALKKLEKPTEHPSLKLSEIVSYAKLILGDVLTAQIMAAKKPVVIDKDGNTIEPDDDDDDAAAERAMADA